MVATPRRICSLRLGIRCRVSPGHSATFRRSIENRLIQQAHDLVRMARYRDASPRGPTRMNLVELFSDQKRTSGSLLSPQSLQRGAMRYWCRLAAWTHSSTPGSDAIGILNMSCSRIHKHTTVVALASRIKCSPRNSALSLFR